MEKRRVLIVDDEPGVRESLRMVLKDQYDAVLAELPATPQRRSWWPARRIADMTSSRWKCRSSMTSRIV